MKTLILILLIQLGLALKFTIDASSELNVKKKCFANYAPKDTLIVVHAKVSGSKDDGQRLDMVITDSDGNDYGKPKDIAGESKVTFNTHKEAYFDVCFTNTLIDPSKAGVKRDVELDVDIGPDSRSTEDEPATQKLSTVSKELLKLDEMLSQIVNQLEYLRNREQKLRDTNESTNERVKYFSLLTMIGLVSVGGWQVVYLRNYFKRKHLI